MTALTAEQYALREQLETDLAAAGHRNTHQRSDETTADHLGRLESIDHLARIRTGTTSTSRRVRITSPDTPTSHGLIGIDIGDLVCWCHTCDALELVPNTRRVRLPNGRIGNFHTRHLDYLETT